jgi:hypothetical protein
MSNRLKVVLVLLASIVLTGCGLRDPYEAQTASPAPGASKSVPAEAAGAAQLPVAPSARQVMARYAYLWVNWTTATLPARRRELAALAAGQLAVELHREATEFAQTVSGAYSRGRLVGVIAQADGRAIVLLFEQTAPVAGAAQGTYYVYLARTARTPRGWRLTGWQLASDG